MKENYLDKKPVRKKEINWYLKDGRVALEIINKGFFNFIAQKLFKKPKISYIYLDETGTFLWPLLDGEKTVFELGKLLGQEFGEKAEPLYERLTKFLNILKSYKFIYFV